MSDKFKKGDKIEFDVGSWGNVNNRPRWDQGYTASEPPYSLFTGVVMEVDDDSITTNAPGGYTWNWETDPDRMAQPGYVRLARYPNVTTGINNSNCKCPSIEFLRGGHLDGCPCKKVRRNPYS